VTADGVVVDGINKSFGDVIALRDINFAVAPGEVLGLLGPNGAGKTTMVDILSTLTRQDSGTARVAGHDVVANPAKVRRAIMLTGQQVAVDNMLTGRQNLVMFGRLLGLRKTAARNRATELLHELDLDDAADRRVGTYSGGMRRRIDLACGLIVAPDVAFLDEPTTGLDPRSRQSIWELIGKFRDAGIATLLTTQYLEEADALCDRIVLLDRGTVIAEGTADELKQRTGGGFVEIVLKDSQDVAAAVVALGALLPYEHRGAVAANRIVMPAPDGADTLIEALRRLDSAGIQLADVALRRPSLDDVFFAFTEEPSMS
jgi:ABC-2 type transport system ATP-binding protein